MTVISKILSLKSNILISSMILVCLSIMLTMPGSIQASAKKPDRSVVQDRSCVVLLHGLGRTRSSMNRLQKAFEREGYLTSNIGYPSRKYSIEQLAFDAIPEGINRCMDQGADRIHFVTHSMGGILLRYYLKQESIQGLGHTVMLAPPNQGSEIVDEVGHMGFYKFILGPAGLQLSARPDSIPNTLGPVDYSVGIIAGNRPSFFDSQFANTIPGIDDGKVSIKSARLEGMNDFIVVPYSHTMIMKGDEVIVQALQYIREGSFYPEGSTLPKFESFESEDPLLDYSD